MVPPSPAPMPARDFDLIVVGGGPAGSTAAALACRRGLSVLLVEKERFPRFHIGESLLPMCNVLMRETGAWERVAAAGFIVKHGAIFQTADGRASLETLFRDGLVPGLDHTFQVDRARYDQLLLDHARDLGAEVRLETAAREIRSEEGGHQLLLEGPAGTGWVRAPWLIDATGRENLLATPQKRDLDPPRLERRMAIYGHFLGIPRPPGEAAGHTLAVRLEDGWFWFIPIDGERTSVGLVAPSRALQGAGAPEELFRRTVAGSVRLRELFAAARPAIPLRVTSDYSYFRRELAAERMILVGDAAGFFDPIFSSGIYMSMWSARAAVELLARARAAGRGLTARERRGYTRRVKSHARVFETLIRTFYDKAGFSVFMTREAPLRVRAAVNSILAGHVRLIWPIWWRFQIFRAACWIQRHYPLCPRVETGGTVAAEPV